MAQGRGVVAGELPYAGQKWCDIHHSLRNSVEGINGTAKSDGVTSIDIPVNRRTMGLAATSVFTACLIATENLRKNAAFYDKAAWNPDGAMTNHTPKNPAAAETAPRARNTTHPWRSTPGTSHRTPASPFPRPTRHPRLPRSTRRPPS